MSDTTGCPECDWDGEIAVTHDRSFEYYTHVVIRNGEMLKGKTCRRPTNLTQQGYDVSQTLKSVITDKQFEALHTAYDSGYFDWPRENSGQEVAGKLGISQPTFSRHMRTAQRRLLSLLFQDKDD